MERRLTAILVADVVGYSRLMEDDEAATLATLKSHRRELINPKTEQYHGRTIKLLGDGALMEFASAVDAVMFAVEVQRAVEDINATVPEGRKVVRDFHSVESVHWRSDKSVIASIRVRSRKDGKPIYAEVRGESTDLFRLVLHK